MKQGLSYISFCPFRILYKSKFILMATSLGTNAVVITKVHCNCSAVRLYSNFMDSLCIIFQGPAYCLHVLALTGSSIKTDPRPIVYEAPGGFALTL